MRALSSLSKLNRVQIVPKQNQARSSLCSARSAVIDNSKRKFSTEAEDDLASLQPDLTELKNDQMDRMKNRRSVDHQEADFPLAKKLARCKTWREAMPVFQEVLSQEQRYSTYMASIIFHMFRKVARQSLSSREIHQFTYMQDKVLQKFSSFGIRLGAAFYSALVESNAFLHLTTRMKHFMSEMLEQNLRPKYYLYFSCVRALYRERQYDEALEYWHASVAAGYNTASLMFGLVMQIYAEAGRDPREVKEKFEQSSLRWTLPLYSSYMTALSRCRLEQDLLQTWDRMCDELAPDTVAAEVYTWQLCNLNMVIEAEAFYEQLKTNLRPLLTIRCVNALLSLYARLERPVRATHIWDELAQLGLNPTEMTLNNMLTANAKGNRITDAEYFWNRLVASGVEPDLVAIKLMWGLAIRKKDTQVVHKLVGWLQAPGTERKIPSSVFYPLNKLLQRKNLPPIAEHYVTSDKSTPYEDEQRTRRARIEKLPDMEGLSPTSVSFDEKSEEREEVGLRTQAAEQDLGEDPDKPK